MGTHKLSRRRHSENSESESSISSETKNTPQESKTPSETQEERSTKGSARVMENTPATLQVASPSECIDESDYRSDISMIAQNSQCPPQLASKQTIVPVEAPSEKQLPKKKPRQSKKQATSGTTLPETKISLSKPYIVMFQIPENEAPYPPPYPPILPGQSEITEEQKSELYRRPIVDLRRETFISDQWRDLWKSSGTRVAELCEAVELQAKETQREKKHMGKEMELSEDREQEQRYTTLEGPREMPSGKRGRQIVRYRVRAPYSTQH